LTTHRRDVRYAGGRSDSDAAYRVYGGQEARMDVIVRKHGLQPLPYEQVSSWPFADAILRLMEYDNITSTIKARRAGFHDCIDTEDMFKSFFANLRKGRVIP
jgi:hypothetical protein